MTLLAVLLQLLGAVAASPQTVLQLVKPGTVVIVVLLNPVPNVTPVIQTGQLVGVINP